MEIVENGQFEGLSILRTSLSLIYEPCKRILDTLSNNEQRSISSEDWDHYYKTLNSNLGILDIFLNSLKDISTECEAVNKDQILTLLKEKKEQLQDNNAMKFYQELKKECETINQYSDPTKWSPQRLKQVLGVVIGEVALLRKNQYHKKKAISFSMENINKKLASIIRKRKKSTNKIFLSCKNRISKDLTLEDLKEFFKSKQLWQAIISENSEILDIHGTLPGSKKEISHLIYCNKDLDIDILRLVKLFILELAGEP